MNAGPTRRRPPGRSKRVAAIVALGLVLTVVGRSGEAARPELPPALLARMPADLRSEAARDLQINAADEAAWMNLTEGDLRDRVMLELARMPAAADFILGKLPGETEGTKLRLLAHLARDPQWPRQEGVDAALTKLTETDPSPDVALAAERARRSIETARYRATLQARLGRARQAGDAALVRRLEDEDERAMVAGNGALLPDFLRHPPPPFAARPDDRPVRVLAFGDFGTGAAAQREVAAALLRLHHAKAFDLGITLGDNFYPDGARSLADPRWGGWWEELYGPLGIPFYAVLGNHDWNQSDGPAAEILYSRLSASWKMPAPYYTFTAGPVQFFALDTSEISDAQLSWLRQAIAASTRRWKIVYGHHPIYRPTNGELGQPSPVRDRLWPVLRGRVDAYLCGHLHAMGRMEQEDGVHFLMAGGGGAPLAEVDAGAPRTRFAAMTYGFLVLEAETRRLVFQLHDGGGRLLDSETVEK